MVIVLNRVDPNAIALGSAGIPIPNPHSASYQKLWEAFGNQGDHNPVLTALGGRLYLPKVYQANGEPVLQWGDKVIPIDLASQTISVSWDLADTGFVDPCIVLSLEADSLDFAFPVALKDHNPTTWVLSAAKDAKKAVSLLMPLDPTIGFPKIEDTSLAEYQGEVRVLGAVSREGKDFGKGKTLIINALVEIDNQGEKVKVVARGHSSTSVLASSLLKSPMNLKGIMGCTEYNGKKFTRLMEVKVTKEDIVSM